MGYTQGVRADTPFIERLEACSIPVTESGCWIWLGSLRKGYGIYQEWNLGNPKTKTAHRDSYEYFCGPVPKGKVLDHLCRIRCCVNPDHLEPVTVHENWRRGLQTAVETQRIKTHCSQGHPYQQHKGRRRCKICEAAAARQRYAASQRQTI